MAIPFINTENDGYAWSFSTVGGVKRVNLESAEDLINLPDLDPKLWTALSCPIDNLEISKEILALIDTDHDRQIRVPEVIAAMQWVMPLLKDPGDLLKQEAVLPLEAINDQNESGATLLDTATRLLSSLGKSEVGYVTPTDLVDSSDILKHAVFNGDGVITIAAANSTLLQNVINDIIAGVGSVPDLSGEQGINADLVDRFFSECNAYFSWMQSGIEQEATIFPFGDGTQASFAAFSAIRAKVDDYFLRCRLAAYDRESTMALNLQTDRVASITGKDLLQCLDEIGGFPLARIEAGHALPLKHGLNPVWEPQMARFAELVLAKVAPGSEWLDEQQWGSIISKFLPFEQWMAAKAGQCVAGLGTDRIADLLDGNFKDELMDLIARDKQMESESVKIANLRKLTLLYGNIIVLLKNFVTFYDFYSPGTKAIFQAGTLYIDQRSCSLCIRVADSGKHSTIASHSGMFLIYCDCMSRSTNEKITIAAALTNGDIDNLVVGKNALFYDRNGRDWDATVVKIVDNPISITQAFFSPYRKVSRFIETQINKFATTENDKSVAGLTKGVESVPVKADEAKPKKEAAPPFDVGKFVGIFAAIGLAIGAIGTAIASVVAGFMKLELWKMPLAIAGIIMLISGPAMIIAYLKLRKRNLAPILDANGWAINAHVIVNITFGNNLTQLAELPKGARININDPFTKKKRPVLPVILFIFILLGVVLVLLFRFRVIHWHF